MSTNRREQELEAVRYAERYGIVNYRVNGYFIIYNVSFPAYLSTPRHTIQHKVDLRTRKEVETRVLKRYDPKGEVNR